MSDSATINTEVIIDSNTSNITPQFTKRKSQLSKRFRVDNEEDRRLLKEKVVNSRLEQLENDNEQSININEDNDDDYQEEEEDLVYTTPVNKRRQSIAREKKKNEKKSMNLNFNEVLEKSYLETYPDHVPTYISVQSKPSSFPQRHFCSICGYIGSYTCKQCSSRYCCEKCYGVHSETRCKSSVYY
ncbi:hypothetical protein DICPUDRAFT_156709 [Dictyostelium purpureum]|uniref:HIT-type domain-containing protein n=1 Tax=Dictyostelium purpureum TaxID=5786 RepID=F0ZX80_DICPU|nr:uncharacterized protein DICPUDRAFT_156709 [Dictyostelium purpureum]EGC31457.1 hypothetical protein DICPUDRAFT_156709 [Dictyostelium purpureum]|eukprot:XP_003292026.1 hypothetical protein DICPUDRAFT_156709 [Dictyostelium purpureum]